ncbi:ABC transporter substrate-binding protein [Butyrivibrio sp. XPD2006]|uniref:ABC transporter substrate-binding protein n=1 Tax=Butyrivibrio sp. XPD2006 TaxID=1280668 RepID=UPI0003B560AA|nr:ABC transporter substrate-binding protein [Butyrivibrio sp. XPD2006]
MRMNKSKRILSSVALILILAMVIGTIASALMGCGAVEKKDDTVIRIGGMKGATTIGLVNLVDKINKGEASNYSFEMYTVGSDVMAAMVAGEVDIATVPANVACVMNTKVEGGVSVIDINTLGVLNCISAGDQITSVSDLSGMTVYTTGQGAVPEYTIRYLLEANGVTDCNLEFKSEPTEIVSIFADNADAVAILPQPFVTAALAQNESLKIAFDLNDEWAKVNTDCKIVTGVTVATNSFIKEHGSLVDAFLKEHKESADKALSDVDTTAALVVEQGIIAKEPLAKKAIPNCNITCITGKEMKDTLAGYLKVLFEQDPKSVGGSIPGDEFYYGA